MTLNPQTTPISAFCVVFNIFIVGKHKDLKFGVQVDRSKSQPMDDLLTVSESGMITSCDSF